ncbi:hypothetical protein BC628DRAFT_1404352 [Trametes gibbosa]|nr:hypothetical protein BC628DRAFT_1404352 [Trametes gibbosa]
MRGTTAADAYLTHAAQLPASRGRGALKHHAHDEHHRQRAGVQCIRRWGDRRSPAAREDACELYAAQAACPQGGCAGHADQEHGRHARERHDGKDSELRRPRRAARFRRAEREAAVVHDKGKGAEGEPRGERAPVPALRRVSPARRWAQANGCSA